MLHWNNGRFFDVEIDWSFWCLTLEVCQNFDTLFVKTTISPFSTLAEFYPASLPWSPCAASTPCCASTPALHSHWINPVCFPTVILSYMLASKQLYTYWPSLATSSTVQWATCLWLYRGEGGVVILVTLLIFFIQLILVMSQNITRRVNTKNIKMHSNCSDFIKTYH